MLNGFKQFTQTFINCKFFYILSFLCVTVVLSVISEPKLNWNSRSLEECSIKLAHAHLSILGLLYKSVVSFPAVTSISELLFVHFQHLTLVILAATSSSTHPTVLWETRIKAQ